MPENIIFCIIIWIYYSWSCQFCQARSTNYDYVHVYMFFKLLIRNYNTRENYNIYREINVIVFIEIFILSYLSVI